MVRRNFVGRILTGGGGLRAVVVVEYSLALPCSVCQPSGQVCVVDIPSSFQYVDNLRLRSSFVVVS